MSVFNPRVYSKKWQSPLKVTAISVFGLFKELFAYNKKGATKSLLIIDILPFGWIGVSSITVFFADLSIPTSDCKFGMFLNRSLPCYGNSLFLGCNYTGCSLIPFTLGNPLIAPGCNILIFSYLL